MRYLLYSHDGLGLGHTRRNLAVAAALTELQPGASVLLATGLETFGHLGLPRNVAVVRLPGVKKLDNDEYGARELPLSFGDLVQVRAGILEAVVERFRPAVLLADKHPFGVGEELLPALEALRRQGGRAALGLRDILDDWRTVRAEWTRQRLADRIPRYYDLVLIYGLRQLFDPITAYAFSSALAQRTVFCGYVLNRVRRQWRETDAPPRAEPGRPTVLATAGGGQDGREILDTFIDAARRKAWNAVVVSGPEMLERVRHALGTKATKAGVAFRSFMPGLHRWFESAAAVVSMGGYNTLIEAVAAGTPTVCVPRVTPRTEQLLRANAFSQRGLVRLLPPDRLSAGSLQREVEAAIEAPREELCARIKATLDFGGAHAAASHLLELARQVEDIEKRPTDVASRRPRSSAEPRPEPTSSTARRGPDRPRTRNLGARWGDKPGHQSGADPLR